MQSYITYSKKTYLRGLVFGIMLLSTVRCCSGPALPLQGLDTIRSIIQTYCCFQLLTLLQLMKRKLFSLLNSLLPVLVCSGCRNRTITDWVASTSEMCFLTVLEAGSPSSRCWQGWFLGRPLSLACRWPFSLCASTLGVSSSSQNNSSFIELGPHLYNLI